MSENKEEATGTTESPIIIDVCDDVESLVKVERSRNQFRSPVKVVPGCVNQFRYVCDVFIR